MKEGEEAKPPHLPVSAFDYHRLATVTKPIAYSALGEDAGRGFRVVL